MIIVEQAASGHQLLQELMHEFRHTPRTRSGSGQYAGWSPRAYTPTVDKVTRMSAQAVKLEDGRAMLPREVPWLADLRSELLAVPNGKYDDQVDSISQFLEMSGRMATSHERRRIVR